MLTRRDARMIADELYRLMSESSEQYLSTKEAAEFMGVSESYVRHNISDIPHTKKGRRCSFKKSALSQYMERLN